MELYLKKNKLKNIAHLLKSANGEDTQVNIENFKKALSEVDSQMKNLPATAQVSNNSITKNKIEQIHTDVDS